MQTKTFFVLCLGLVAITGPLVAQADDTAASSAALATIASTQSFFSYLTPAVTERILTRYFADAPDMVGVAECESGFRQYNQDGSVLRGGYGGSMIGLFQLHEKYHRPAAEAMGLDIDSLFGNIAYAKHLYQTEGLDPWLDSLTCRNIKMAERGTEDAVKNRIVVASVQGFGGIEEKGVSGNELQSGPAAQSSTEVHALSQRLEFGMVHEEVRQLQMLLNARGFPVAESGPGSRGNETNYFGTLTKRQCRHFSVRRISCAEKTSLSTAWWMVLPETR
jgi:hypothetical protein